MYFFSQDGTTKVLKPGQQYELLAENTLDGEVRASPAVSGNSLFIRTRTHLYRVEQRASVPAQTRSFGDSFPDAIAMVAAEREDPRAKPAALAPPAGRSAASQKPARPEPTLANVPYGEHARQVLDFYQASSARPTPLLFNIHGGGWVAGDKASVDYLEQYLAAGISVVSINYRYSTQAQLAGVEPPVSWPLHDAARALQFVRTKARAWNLDKVRIAASGGSAGACSSLWLALHDDLADPRSEDPVARESTRLWCAAVSGAQTTLDPQQMYQWTPNSRYGGHAFGFMPDPRDRATRDTQFPQFLAARERILPWIRQYSPYEHVSPDDPPIYMIYPAPPALGENQRDPTHTANFGVKLQERLREAGVECELVYPGAPDVEHPQLPSFVIEKLQAANR
jgi:acetyl esterase/lipase